MKFHGIQIEEGTRVSNLTVAQGTAFPVNAENGELFYRSDESLTIRGLYCFIGSTWDRLASSDSLTAPSGTSLPVAANPGDLFYKNSNDQSEGLYCFNDSAWVAVSSSSASYTISGDVSGTVDGGTDALTLATVNTTIGTFGSATKAPVITVNGKGLVTASSDVTVTPSFSSITSKPTTLSGYGITDALPLTGGTLTGDLNMSANIVPTTNITYDLGSPTKMWRDIYVGPGSIYMNGKKILEDVSDTITFTTDLNQNLRVETSGTGNLELMAGASGAILMKGALQIASGKKILDTAGTKVEFGDDIDMSTNKVINMGTPVNGSDATTKTYVDGLTTNDTTIVRTSGNQTIAGNKTFTGTTIIQGDLSVTGTVTTVNSETVNIADNIIELNSNFTTGSPTENAGFQVRRGDLGVARFIWDEANDRFTMQDGQTTPGNLSLYTTATISAGTFIGALTGNASTASALSTARTISATGDAAWSVTFDGSANATGSLTLASISTAGTYRSVSIDAKGRVTSGTNPTTLSGYGITDAQSLDADLTALAAVSGTGLLTRTGDGTASVRSIAVSGVGLSISNSDAVAGNPTISSNATNAATANTIVARDSSGSTNLQSLAMSGLLVINSGSTATNGIELGSTNGASSPYIDFHSGATPTDFDSRIQGIGGTGTAQKGSILYLAEGGHAFTGATTIVGTGAGSTLIVNGSTNTGRGAEIALYGNGTTTPNKHIRVLSGQLEIVNSAYTAVIMSVSDTGAVGASAFNGNTYSGYAISEGTTGSSLAARTSAGYLYASYFNQSSAPNENPTISQVMVTSAADTFMRKASVAHLTSSLSGTAPISITGNAGSVSNLTINSDFTGNLNTATTAGFYRLQSGNTNTPASNWQFGQLLTMRGGADTITQIVGSYNTGELFTRSGNSSDVGGSGAWTAWKTVLDSLNFNAYAPTLTGTGASGTWGISITGQSATTKAVGTTDPSVGTGGLWVTSATGLNVARAGTFYTVLDAANYNNYSPTLTGTGASGTWNITSVAAQNQVQSGTPANANTYFTTTTAGYRQWSEVNGGTNYPNTGWFFIENFKHSNGSNSWGKQIAHGWEDNALETYSRNITSGTFSGWTRHITSNNIGSFAPTLTGTGASGTWNINITGSAASATTATTATSATTAQLLRPVNLTGTNVADLILSQLADNDFFRLRVGGTASNAGFVELATSDDGTEPIYVRQYSGAFGTIVKSATLLDESGNTSFPGTITAPSFAGVASKANTVALGGAGGAPLTFTYSGQSGQPSWLWGTNDGVNAYVWNPSNFNVNYATSAGNSATTSQNSFNTLIAVSTGNTATAGAVAGLQATAANSGVGATMSFHRPGIYAVNMGLDSDNVFRIGGWSAAANRLQLDMSGNLYLAGDVQAFSDIRKKKDISTIENALDKVCDMRGVMFTRIEDDVRSTGVIAQEIQEVLPEVVKADADGILSVAYGNISGILIEAIKELRAEVESLKKQLAEKQ